MGSIAVLGQSNAQNLIHIIFNNGVHDSVGGQPTVGFDINFSEIANACGYSSSVTAISQTQFKNAIHKAQSMPGPHLIDVHVRPGNRNDIGRPTSSPIDNKNAIMRFLGTL
jgi:phosphonopyruvate decarboxylase